MLRLFSLIIVAFVALSTAQVAEAHTTKTVCENVKANWIWVPAVTDTRGHIIIDGYYTHWWEKRCRTVNVHHHHHAPPPVVITTGHHHHHHHHRKPKVKIRIRL